MISPLLACLMTFTTLVEPPPVAEPALPSVTEITKHLDDLYRSDASHGRMRMDVKTSRYERSLTLEIWSRGKEESLAVIRSPAREAGTATLRTEEGMWNYAPRADRLMRIPTSLLSDSWMGSHFTNDDLMRESSWEEDYTAKMAWAKAGGKRVLEAVFVPRPDAPVVYSRVVFQLTADGKLPLETRYYDGDEVVRVLKYEQPKPFGGRTIPTVMRIIPTDKPNEQTVVTYEAMNFSADVPRRLFTPRGLRKATQSR